MSNRPVIADEPGPGLSYKEKSLWFSLLSTIAVYAYYFWQALSIGDGDPERVAELFLGIVVAFVILQIVVHIALALHHEPEPTDERDKRVAMRGAQLAYHVLMAGLWTSLSVAALSLGTFWFAHAALLAIVLAELARYASQLYFYRGGA